MSTYINIFTLKWRIWEFREPLDYYILLLMRELSTPLLHEAAHPLTASRKTEKCSGSIANQIRQKLFLRCQAAITKKNHGLHQVTPAWEEVSPTQTPEALSRCLWPNPSCLLTHLLLLIDLWRYRTNMGKVILQLLNFHLCCLELYIISAAWTCREPAATAWLSGKSLSLGLVQKKQGHGRTKKGTWD